MRRKKHKSTRRIVGFYRLNHGFREPFKVLLDGNFIHASVQSNMNDLKDHISRLLGGKVKPYTTQCVMHELRALGPDYKATSRAAREYELHKCGHEEAISAADCLLAQLGKRNKDHWWVASQDRSLRGALGQLAAAPCIHMSVNGLHLEQPSDMAKSHVKQAEVDQLALPAHERQSEALKDLELIRPKLITNVKFRKAKTRGPNPLAVKKKSKKGSQSAPAAVAAAATVAAQSGSKSGSNSSGNVGGGDGGEDAKAKAKRKRRKNKGGGSAGGETAVPG